MRGEVFSDLGNYNLSSETIALFDDVQKRAERRGRLAGTDDLLYFLLRDKICETTLRNFGVDFETLKTRILAAGRSSRRDDQGVETTNTHEASGLRAVLNTARVSANLGTGVIKPEHLMSGLLLHSDFIGASLLGRAVNDVGTVSCADLSDYFMYLGNAKRLSV